VDSIPYGRQSISDEDIAAVVNTLRSPFLTQGPKIREFEDAFAAYTGARYAVAVSNGTAALHLAAMALGVNEHSRVITTPITFAASANCVRYCGGSVEFVDIRSSDATLDLDLVEQKLEAAPPGTYHGLIPVDFAGRAVDLERCRSLADRFHLWMIEDACHSPGGSFMDRNGQAQKCGNGKFAEASVFSFHPVKHIACGEGGMITTDSEKIYQQLLRLRTHGITKVPSELLRQDEGPWYYEMQDLGYNYRLTDFQAALGLSQLARADQGLSRRREIARRYDQAFHGSAVEALCAGDGEGHAYHLYVVLVENRRGLYEHLHSQNIYPQVHYVPVHKMPYYRNLGCDAQCPNADAYYDRCLSLPMFPTLSDEQQERVIGAVLEFAS
jgi:UDP-4-amino-4,6-dideoxy-N-acetyl-beta-L-altrosamine transaminase